MISGGRIASLGAELTQQIGVCSLAFAQPYVNYGGVVNVASHMAPGLSAGSLARGGMLAIFRRNL